MAHVTEGVDGAMGRDGDSAEDVCVDRMRSNRGGVGGGACVGGEGEGEGLLRTVISTPIFAV